MAYVMFICTKLTISHSLLSHVGSRGNLYCIKMCYVDCVQEEKECWRPYYWIPQHNFCLAYKQCIFQYIGRCVDWFLSSRRLILLVLNFISSVYTNFGCSDCRRFVVYFVLRNKVYMWKLCFVPSGLPWRGRNIRENVGNLNREFLLIDLLN